MSSLTLGTARHRSFSFNTINLSLVGLCSGSAGLFVALPVHEDSDDCGGRGGDWHRIRRRLRHQDAHFAVVRVRGRRPRACRRRLPTRWTSSWRYTEGTCKQAHPQNPYCSRGPFTARAKRIYSWTSQLFSISGEVEMTILIAKAFSFHRSVPFS